MKLVKNVKVAKFPRSCRTVKQAIKKAEDIAQKEGWTKVIIIGQGTHASSEIRTRMRYSDQIFMLESSKYLALKDWAE